MHRDEALKLLTGGPDGIKEWNRRRDSNVAIPFFEGINLVRADLSGANLSFAVLRGADLRGADLHNTNLARAVLCDVNLCRVDLHNALLYRADLRGAKLRGASCGGTLFLDVDLADVQGLDELVHTRPSTVGSDTLFRSRGKIPDAFLRGCGVPEVLIKSLPALIESMSPNQFCSCFISYSTKDENFATKLYTDLTNAGILCWKWDHDARTGHTIWSEIDRAILGHDKLVLIASEASLKSPQVNREIERAIQEEDRRSKLKLEGEFHGDTNVLFPVRLDDYVFQDWSHPRKADVVAKVIADARGWEKGRKVYSAVRDRLFKDLKVEKSTGAKHG
jgi:uncharacterized protein YjbI with pentapeptide repeats